MRPILKGTIYDVMILCPFFSLIPTVQLIYFVPVFLMIARAILILFASFLLLGELTVLT